VLGVGVDVLSGIAVELSTEEVIMDVVVPSVV